jgi:hypothetical protein
MKPTFKEYDQEIQMIYSSTDPEEKYTVTLGVGDDKEVYLSVDMNDSPKYTYFNVDDIYKPSTFIFLINYLNLQHKYEALLTVLSR